MDRIILNEIKGKIYKVLSGGDLGAEAREFFGLDLIDSQENIVTFVVPDEVFSVNSSFFSGAFQKSIKALGVEKFRERYLFECDDIIRMNIENGIFNIANTVDLLGGQS